MKILKIFLFCFVVTINCYGILIFNNQCPNTHDYTIEFFDEKQVIMQSRPFPIGYWEIKSVDVPQNAKFVRVKFGPSVSQIISIEDNKSYEIDCLGSKSLGPKPAYPRIILQRTS